MTIKALPYESIESMLRRFKKGVTKNGILADARKHEYHEKPSVKRKRKSLAARARRLKEEKL